MFKNRNKYKRCVAVLLFFLLFFWSCDNGMITDDAPDDNTENNETTGGDNGDSGDGTESEELTNYPVISWHVNTADDSREITTAPSEESFFTYQSLIFDAEWNGESASFGVSDCSISDAACIVSVLLSGDISFFEGHTIEFEIVIEATDGNYYYHTYQAVFDTVGLGMIMEFFAPDPPINIVNSGTAEDPEYRSCFKEIRFLATDSINYYTWTNPGL